MEIVVFREYTPYRTGIIHRTVHTFTEMHTVEKYASGSDVHRYVGRTPRRRTPCVSTASGCHPMIHPGFMQVI
ncbi:MAG: hypothetical protein LUF85_09205 [Bacteroides sp.]|nr:hypothetical protein [Bacteroides sp.]